MKNSATISATSPPLLLLLRSEETHVKTGNRKQDAN
jgi:hypothetical protein